MVTKRPLVAIILHSTSICYFWVLLRDYQASSCSESASSDPEFSLSPMFTSATCRLILFCFSKSVSGCLAVDVLTARFCLSEFFLTAPLKLAVAGVSTLLLSFQ